MNLADLFAAPPEVYLLALVPAVLWGLSPVFSKRGMSGGGNPLQASLTVVVVDSALYWAVLLALRGTDVFAGLTPATLALFAVAGLVGTSLGRIAVFIGVERVGAAVNSAAISTRPLFATALAVGFLGERVTLTTGVGVVGIAAGLLVLATARGGDISGWEPRDLLYPVAAAGAFAVGNVLRRFGLQATPTGALEAVALNETAALVGLAAFVAATRGRDVLDAPRRTFGYFAASGTLTAVALLSLFAAFAHPAGKVAVVDPLAATAPLFTAGFAAVLLEDVEAVTRGVVAGAALIVVGVALVVASTGGAPA
ncbi:EamA family transporter [Halorarius halobius]|uniref:EamA family transporter n=1 Tax=Halorarius halobius TaxID=2962671 RepID=UPI0020CC7FE8|nr:EamA family transporter [Halorarius halobius]